MATGKCFKCNGTGKYLGGNNPCFKCKGTGVVFVPKNSPFADNHKRR